MLDLQFWENQFREKIIQTDLGQDSAHDLAHFQRVVTSARRLAQKEGANLEIVIPAAWLHDLVNAPKSDPRRSVASRLSAEASIEYLKTIHYPSHYLDKIAHAIEAHSFSAKIEPKTLEAKIVQDADRLDGLGAIGIARCFSVGGLLQRPFYDPLDPFGKNREFDDRKYTLDHFFVKLFRVGETLQTQAGREEGAARIQMMKEYLEQLEKEISLN